MDTWHEWSNWLDDEEQAEDIRRWDLRCLIWEAISLTAMAVLLGGCTAVAVWLW